MGNSFRDLFHILSEKDGTESQFTSDEKIFINTAKLLSYFCGSLSLLIAASQSHFNLTPLTAIVFIIGSVLSGFIFLLVCQLVSSILLKSHSVLLRFLPIIPPVLVLIWYYFNLNP